MLATWTSSKYKWKVRINVDGSKQVYGVHYEETYPPVVAWATTRFFLLQSLLNNWHTRQLDFAMAFPQAPVERELYIMEIPKGVNIEDPESSTVMKCKDYVLQILNNLYGQKHASWVWYQYLVKGLLELGFKQSKVDKCVFYYGSSILLVYVDDSILMGPDDKELQKLVSTLSKHFEIQEEGDLCDYLGINIVKHEDGSLTLTQPQLIDSILQDLKLDQGNVNLRLTPAFKTVILHKDADGKDFNGSFHYHSIIGKLNYLEKSTRPEIAYAVHQCARFSSCPKQSHAEAVKQIGRYLAGTKEKGTTI